MAKQTFFTLILLSASLLVKSQTKQEVVSATEANSKIDIRPEKAVFIKKYDIREVIFKSVRTNRFTDSIAVLPINEAHLFSIAVSFDSRGDVDTSYFSAKMTPRLTELFMPSKELKTAISRSIHRSKVYKDVVVLFPVIFHYRDHKMIDKSIFMQDWSNLWPSFSPKDSLKKLILLEPYNCWIWSSHRQN
ncbi:hypothetical protein ACXZ1K_07775 [Pedobacter sp. PWIIR3]